MQRLSRLARVSEDALRRQMPRRSRPQPRRRDEDDASPASLPGRQAGEGASPIVNTKPLRNPREEYALAMLFLRPEVAPHGQGVSGELFTLSENRELFRRWSTGETVSEDESELFEHLQEVLQTRIPLQETGQAEEAFLDCVGSRTG